MYDGQCRHLLEKLVDNGGVFVVEVLPSNARLKRLPACHVRTETKSKDCVNTVRMMAFITFRCNLQARPSFLFRLEYNPC